MKFMKKLNKGVVLLAFVIIAVAIYLSVNAVTESKDKTKIKELCEEYVAKEISYNMLPEQYRSDGTKIATNELDTYIKQMKEELSDYYVDNEQCYSYLLNNLEESLQNQQKGLSVVSAYEKSIIKFDKITFYDDSASVQISCNTTYEGTVPTGEINNLNSQTIDTITLQKVNGKWKITYSNLINPVTTVDYNSEKF